MLQWEWLGGLPPLRRAAVIDAGEWGRSLAEMLGRAGLDVDLGTRTAEQVEALAGDELHRRVSVRPARQLELSRHDLVVFAVPPAALPAAVAAHGEGIAPRTGVLVGADGAAYVAERVRAWAVGAIGDPVAALEKRAPLTLAARDRAFARQVTGALSAAGYGVTVAGIVAPAPAAGLREKAHAA
jgi:hypothetical protein